ncbi:MAG: Hsp20/alpha crystallin family protein [bacterium]
MRSLVLNPNRIANDFDAIVNSFLNAPKHNCDNGSCFMPRVNIEETKDDVALTFELPGMEKDNIKVVVKDDVLTVSGERKVEKNDEQKSDGEYFIRREIRSGQFERSFTMPDTVNKDSINADYKNGLLVVKLQKKEEVKPKEIEVKIA